MFSSVSQFLAPALKENNITLTSLAEPDSLRLNADRELIEQALINLALNSVKALEGKTDSIINIRAEINEKGKTVIQVSDNGKGIPAEIIDNIFVPFFTTTKNGTGIGLSLIKQIMRLHNATVSVSSKETEGTVFTLSF
jgi:signal transduction histidine kinase